MSGIIVNPYVYQALGPTYIIFRLNITKTTTAGAETGLFRFAPKVGATEYPTSGMTSNTTPFPLVATDRNGAADAYTIFNTNYTESIWDSLPIVSNGAGVFSPAMWIQVNLGAGNGIAPTTFILRSSAGYFPVDIELLGSNDGSSFTSLAVHTGLTTGWISGVDREFSIP